jgi:general secretion pathway protein G
MKTLNYKVNRMRRGFTLIELLVVMLILSLLAALIIPKLIAHIAEAKVAAAKTDLATLKGAVQQYKIDNDKYPSTEEGLNALVVAPSDAPHWKGPYLDKSAVSNDPWGNPYVYVCPGPSGQDFLITSYGSDGAQGGTGDAADLTSDDTN